MKRINLLFILLMMATKLVFSQGLVLVSADTVIYGTPGLQAGPAHAFIQNTSSSNINAKCQRDSICNSAGNNNNFCWVLCYNVSTDLSPTAITIKPDSIDTHF